MKYIPTIKNIFRKEFTEMREAVLKTVETIKEMLGEAVINPNVESQIIIKTLEKLQNPTIDKLPEPPENVLVKETSNKPRKK